MSFVVKNTTKWGWLDLVCPHSCRGCGQLGAVLCECCKKDMLARRKPICPICRQESMSGSCACESPFEGIFVVGWREGALAKLVKDFKYKGVRACGEVLGGLLDETVPLEFGGPEVIIVPLPTIGKHVRARGIDHTLILAKKLAKRRGWKVERVLARAVDTVQVGATAEERQKQAAAAYIATRELKPKATYLLLDDVWTTGATMLSAAKVMRKAGARHMLAAVLETGRTKPTGSE